LREYFQEKQAYFQEDFHFNDLEIFDNGIKWKHITAEKIIFCEGHLGVNNPWFDWLPLEETKGEILIVEIPGFESEYILKRSCSIIPLGGNLFKVGATFDWDDTTEIPTEKGRTELIQKLEKFLKAPYKIVDQEAGLRPTVRDRRPLIGLHPQNSNIGIFNGMGTKGIMLAPWFAQHFTEHVLEGKPLKKEVDIQRFWVKKT